METATAIPPLLVILAQVPDFRQAQGRRYPLLPVLTLACVAMLAGYRTVSAMAEWGDHYGAPWLPRLGFPTTRFPSQSTLHRIFKGLDAPAFEAVVAQWAEAVLTAPALPPLPDLPMALEAVALDGKTLRGSRKQGAPGAHLLSALSQRLGVVLGQVAVDDKTNEIPATQELLAQLVLRGRVITGDALLTQREIAQTIGEAQGDYLLVVKDNQSALRADIELVFAAAAVLGDTIQTTQTVALTGGRVEHRVLRTSTALVGYSDWPYLQQVLQITRTVVIKRTGRQRQEVAYAVTSLRPEQATPAQLLTVWQTHWHIENKLHWVRDVTFAEDRSQVRAGRAHQILAALRNTLIGCLRVNEVTNIAQALRHYAAQPGEALHLLEAGE